MCRTRRRSQRWRWSRLLPVHAAESESPCRRVVRRRGSRPRFVPKRWHFDATRQVEEWPSAHPGGRRLSRPSVARGGMGLERHTGHDQRRIPSPRFSVDQVRSPRPPKVSSQMPWVRETFPRFPLFSLASIFSPCRHANSRNHCEGTKMATDNTVLDEILSGDALTLSAVAQLIPAHRGGGRMSPSTVWRWVVQGTRAAGRMVKLEAARVGNRWLTSRSAVTRYMTALTPGDGRRLLPPIAAFRARTRQGGRSCESPLGRDGSLAARPSASPRDRTISRKKRPPAIEPHCGSQPVETRSK